jgi:hypothetical protein
MKNFIYRTFLFVGMLLLVVNSVLTQEYWGRLNGFPGAYIHALAIDSSGRIYAGSINNGMYRSTDDGITWSQINSGLTTRRVHSIAVHPSGSIFIGTDSGGVYRSTNNGDNWSPIGLVGKVVFSIAIKSSGEIFAGYSYPNLINGGVYRSTNNGVTWDVVGTSSLISVVNVLTVNSSGFIFAGTNGSGVYRSTDNGTNWVHLDLGGRSITSIATGSGRMVFAGTYLEGVFNSTDDGTTWFSYGQSFATCRSLILNSQGDLFAGTDREGVYRSESDGACWSLVGLPNEYIRGMLINRNGYIYACTDIGIYRTINTNTPIIVIDLCTLNFGTLIYSQNTSRTDSFVVRNISAFQVAISSYIISDYSFQMDTVNTSIGSNDSIWFRVTFAPKIAGLHRAKLSITSSATLFPEEVSLTANVQMGTIRLNTKSIGYQIVNIGAGRDTTYTFSNTGNDTLIITNIVSTNPSFNIVSKISDTLAPAGISRDTIRFIPTIEGLISGFILVYSNTPTSPDTIVVSGIGQEPTSVDDESKIVTKFTLEQNYPNPFNPLTVIRYQLPVNSHVTLKVFNIFGEEITTLFDGNISAGIHSVQWNASGLPSGIYFYRLQSGTLIETKKLMLLR